MSFVNTFLMQLRDPDSSICDLLLNVGTGHVLAPTFEGLPAHRWGCLADMAISPDWGLTSIVPMIEDVCARVAQLCQLTAEPVHSLNYLRDLRVAERDDTKLRVAHCGRDTPGAFAALTAVVDLIVDGIDQCHGLEPSGVEALLGAAEAAWEVRGQEARAVLLRAAENWEAICAVPAGLRYAS